MTLSNLDILKRDIHQLIMENEDTELLLRAYELLAGEPYMEDNNFTLKEPDIEYETETTKTFKRIPGLPYTYEERMEALKQAEIEIDKGICIPHEEVMKEVESWLLDGQKKQRGN